MLAKIRKANEHDAETISALAYHIWPVAYKSILTEGQIALMLEKMYALDVLRSAMSCGSEFYLLEDERDVAQAFMGISTKIKDTLRVDKLYVTTARQKSGYGKTLLDFAESEAVHRQLSVVALHVNRFNPALGFYQKCGYEIVSQMDIPFYTYWMEDYVLQKNLKPHD